MGDCLRLTALCTTFESAHVAPASSDRRTVIFVRLFSAGLEKKRYLELQNGHFKIRNNRFSGAILRYLYIFNRNSKSFWHLYFNSLLWIADGQADDAALAAVSGLSESRVPFHGQCKMRAAIGGECAGSTLAGLAGDVAPRS